MNKILISDFYDRVLTTIETIPFSYVDPYGHLNSSRYVELLLNHRITAAEKQLECYVKDISHSLSIGIIVQDLRIQFFNPVFQGQDIEIGSWLYDTTDKGFSIKFVMIEKKSRKIKAQAEVHFAALNLKTGQPEILPNYFPSRSPQNLILSRPLKDEYLLDVIDYRGCK